MKRIADNLRLRWRRLTPEYQEAVLDAAVFCAIAFGAITGAAAVGYWFGYRDARRDGG